MRWESWEERWTLDGATGCHLWARSKTTTGYGQVYLHGRRTGAHRVAWLRAFGPIPDGMCVLHRCDTPACVNPEHLFLGTQQENLLDMQRKKRRRGERNGKLCRLRACEVDEIRRLVGLGVQQKLVAKMFRVSRGHTSNIVSRKSWDV